jgi:hypothetical protein
MPPGQNPSQPQGEFEDDYGVIDVRDEFNRSTLPEPDTAQMVIISSGEMDIGAYSADGDLIEFCLSSIWNEEEEEFEPPIVGPGDPGQEENCDDSDSTVLNGLAGYADGSKNDDVVRVTNISTYSLWSFTLPQQLGPGVLLQRIVPTAGGNIGINTDTPRVSIDVVGDIQANTVIADMYCDTTGGNCMSAESIAGDDPDMECPPGFSANAITESRMDNQLLGYPCIPTTSQHIENNACPAGTAACGITIQEDGTMILLCKDKDDPDGPCEPSV